MHSYTALVWCVSIILLVNVVVRNRNANFAIQLALRSIRTLMPTVTVVQREAKLKLIRRLVAYTFRVHEGGCGVRVSVCGFLR